MARFTLERAVARDGVGLHGGRRCRAVIAPAAAGSGRTINGAAVGIGALVDARLATTLATPGGSVATVEHLLAALVGCGIDDVAITVEGGEVPILDGSAAPWVEAIAEAGRVAVAGEAAPLMLDRAVEIVDGDRWIRASPAARLALDVAIDFPLIGRQRFAAAVADFAAVADARTFGFAAHAAALHAAGRALGASLDNAVVFDAAGRPLAPLRHADEPARHKWLDLLGDLALLGRPLRARVEAFAAGHALHHRLVAALLERAAGSTPGATGRGAAVS